MGEARRSQNSCTAVAVRYRFVWKPKGDGQADLQYLPHKVRKLKHIPPAPVESEELKPEAIEYLDDVEYLRSLDPKEWKHQDHYKVLGIPTLRNKATEEIIRVAYRKKVLKHHPDKRKGKGEEIKDDDDYFTCITMAYETLGNPQKRKAYDSVDPEFNNNIPTSSEIKNDFYKTCTYFFDLNSRWSEKKNVPKLGGPDSTREEVERFYNFWYNFKSWREYSYEDEEDKDKCTDRDERRYVDKLNKAERLRKKKEEMARIRALVDLAYNNDPRISKFKQEEKDRKLAAKRAKQTAAQIKREEAERALKEALLAKEKAEAAERARIDAKRQEREIQKKALKKERKALRDVCKANSYYADNPDQNLAHLTALESICESFSITELEQLNKEIKNKGKSAFLKAINKQNNLVEQEKKAQIEASKPKTVENKNNSVIQVAPEWSEENMQLLVKAVTMFPPGTNQRWEVISNFMNQHGKFLKNSSKFTSKMVLSKTKELQNSDFSKNNLKEEANKQAFDNFKKNKKTELHVNENGISKKMDEMQINDEKKKTEDQKNTKAESAVWTTEEQQLLEQALKTYPASTAERWVRVAECIPNRTKKECIKRYKELVETVKAKKAAKAAVNSVK